MIACSENEDRYLPESENIDGKLFERVMNIAFKLKQLLWASDVIKKIEDKPAEGNKIFFDNIRIAQRLAKKRAIKFPNINNIKKFLKTTKISIIGKELNDLPKLYRGSITIYKEGKKLKTISERNQAEKDFVLESIEFVEKLDKYIVDNKLIGEEIQKKDKSKGKFELIGFLRIYQLG